MLGDMQTCESDWLKGDPLGATGQFPKRRVILKLTKPDGKTMEDLGPAPRKIYPLVLVILPGDDEFYNNHQEGNVGAFIGLFKIYITVLPIIAEFPLVVVGRKGGGDLLSWTKVGLGRGYESC